MDSPASTSSTPSWMYFLAGAIVPTIFFLVSNQSSRDRSSTSEDDEDMDGVVGGGPSSKWGYQDAPYKMVLCVNQELGMGKGKIAAQCCHAAVACYKRASKQCPKGLRVWEVTGCAKIGT